MVDNPIRELTVRIDQDSWPGNVEAMLRDSSAEPLPEPAPTGELAAWLDPQSIGEVVPKPIFNRLLRINTRLPAGVDAPGPRLTVRGEELFGIWEREGSGAGLVIGVSDAFAETGDHAADLAAGRAPSLLPSGRTWELEEWQVRATQDMP